jgi:hypothetical protein
VALQGRASLQGIVVDLRVQALGRLVGPSLGVQRSGVLGIRAASLHLGLAPQILEDDETVTNALGFVSESSGVGVDVLAEDEERADVCDRWQRVGCLAFPLPLTDDPLDAPRMCSIGAKASMRPSVASYTSSSVGIGPCVCVPIAVDMLLPSAQRPPRTVGKHRTRGPAQPYTLIKALRLPEAWAGGYTLVRLFACTRWGYLTHCC